jgi:hypothetical protein
LGGELSIGIISLISNLIIRYHFNRILFLHIQGQAAILTPAPLFMLGNYGTQMLRYSYFSRLPTAWKALFLFSSGLCRCSEIFPQVPIRERLN